MATGSAKLEPTILLGALITNLDHHFFTSDRTNAKKKFQSLHTGGSEPLLKLGFSDQSEIQCTLCLDYSEYNGKLNFTKFRNNLAAMMLAIKETLEQKRPLNQMHSETGEILFNIPGIVQSGKDTNVMVCGLQQIAAGKITFKVMFLNSSAYIESIEEARKNVE